MAHATNNCLVSAAPDSAAPGQTLACSPTSSAASQRIDQLEGDLQELRSTVARLQHKLTTIYSSRGWKLLRRYYGLRAWLLPAGSQRLTLVKRWCRWLIESVRPKQARFRGIIPAREYARWIYQNEPSVADLDKQRTSKLALYPRISIITPTYNTPLPFLRAMIQSVLDQTYSNWELCLADGNSQNPQVKQLLADFAKSDPRIRCTLLPANQGISGNSNAALALATGEYIALLDHDDTLAPFALFEVVQALNREPATDLIYSDEDILAPSGQRIDPHFKPEFSPDTLRSHNYICHLAVVRRSLLEQVGNFRQELDGSQDYDLMLRITEAAGNIIHIPKILYHWRSHPQSVSGDPNSKMYAYKSAQKALQQHLERLRLKGQVLFGPQLGVYQICYALPSSPLVSIIIPNKDQTTLLRRCLSSLKSTRYANFEILLIENNSTEPATFACYDELKGKDNIQILTWKAPFNYAAIMNFAVASAKGDVLVFLNNDVEAIDSFWLERMLEHALRPEVGAVGAKLYYPDNTIQHAGMILASRGVAQHGHRCFPRSSPGYHCRLIAIQNVSAVTGACLMLRKDVFAQVGGFNERYPLDLNDVDLCMKIRQHGYHIVWTPYAELYHHEQQTRGTGQSPARQAQLTAEIEHFLGTWGSEGRITDPYYSPHLTQEAEDFSLRMDG